MLATPEVLPQWTYVLKISRATGYRYLDEAINVLAARAPDLHDVLRKAKADGVPHLVLGGKRQQRSSFPPARPAPAYESLKFALSAA